MCYDEDVSLLCVNPEVASLFEGSIVLLKAKKQRNPTTYRLEDKPGRHKKACFLSGG
jgi:hypothetical protein